MSDNMTLDSLFQRLGKIVKGGESEEPIANLIRDADKLADGCMVLRDEAVRRYPSEAKEFYKDKDRMPALTGIDLFKKKNQFGIGRAFLEGQETRIREVELGFSIKKPTAKTSDKIHEFLYLCSDARSISQKWSESESLENYTNIDVLLVKDLKKAPVISPEFPCCELTPEEWEAWKPLLWRLLLASPDIWFTNIKAAIESKRDSELNSRKSVKLKKLRIRKLEILETRNSGLLIDPIDEKRIVSQETRIENTQYSKSDLSNAITAVFHNLKEEAQFLKRGQIDLIQ